MQTLYRFFHTDYSSPLPQTWLMNYVANELYYCLTFIEIEQEIILKCDLVMLIYGMPVLILELHKGQNPE